MNCNCVREALIGELLKTSVFRSSPIKTREVKEKMKKSTVLLVSLLIAYNVFASGPKWKVIKDTYVYELLWDGINFEKTDKLLKKGTEVTGVWSGTSPNPFTKTEMVNIDEYEKYYIDVMSVVPAESDVLFDDKLLKPNMILNNKVFVAEAYFKALKEQNRNILIELEKEGFKNYEKNKSDMDYEWYESEAQHYYESEIYNVSIMLINVFSSYHFMIRKISKINSGYNVTAAVTLFCEFENKNYIIPEKGDVIELKIVLDGDYLKVYYRENLLGVYIITNKKTSDEIAKFILKNTCNYSFITWPRHADGSCDYDDKVIMPD